MTAAVDLAVVGAGIAGLSAAWAAHRRGLSVAVLESGDTVGGKIGTYSAGGYQCENGPNSFVGSASTIWRLIDELGLTSEVLPASGSGDRYIYRGRSARRLPRSPGDLFSSSDFLSIRGKLRMLCEPFIFGNAREDDTILTFATRRLGKEAARYLVSPFVSGIYAGDADMLGARDAFPQLWQWEFDAGSIAIGALLKRRKKRPSRRGIFTFRSGFQTLTHAIATQLPHESIHLQTPVTQVQRLPDRGFHLQFEGGELLAERVIVATPPRQAASLLPPKVAHLQEALLNVQFCSLAVVHCGGPILDGTPPEGFGMLIPPGEGLRTLGILFPSSVFPQRAPQGHWLHSGFLGGARDPDAVELPDETLLSLVLRAQDQAFAHNNLTCDFLRVCRWPEAIPQYTVGHRQRMQQVRAELEREVPGMSLAGNWLDGVSVNDAAASGIAAVDRLFGAP